MASFLTVLGALSLSLSAAAAAIDPAAFAARKFDYVIVGGGTAGLTLATLLSDDPNVTVGVLEAGGYFPNDLRVLAPLRWATDLVGNPDFDWAFKSIPQANANNTIVSLNRGKSLGGSSTINGMVWIQAPPKEFDSYRQLGIPGWDYDTMMKWSREVEKFTPAPADLPDEYHTNLDPSLHGRNGSVHVTFTNWFSSLIPLWFDVLNKLGVATNEDIYATQKNSGVWTTAVTVNPSRRERSYAVNAYYQPNENRPNLVVLTNARGLKVNLSNRPNAAGNYRAESVVFLSGGRQYTVQANQEVIVSAGSIISSQILEHSGIGNKTLLEKVGVASKINLPGVGENFHDHWSFNSAWEIKPGHTTLDVLRDPAVAAENLALYEANRTGLYTAGYSGAAFLPMKDLFTPQQIQEFKALIDRELPTLRPGRRAQYKVIRNWLDDPEIAFVEILPQWRHFGLPAPPKDNTTPYFTLTNVLQHPFSRGSVHINSSDPTQLGNIDPQAHTHPIDKAIALALMKYGREKIAQTEPFKSLFVQHLWPAPGLTDEQLWYEINTNVFNGHSIGAVALGPRDHDGVVDPNLKVYGTTNLRVVDASVFPIHHTNHIQAPIYAFVHKTAATIKAERRRK